MSKYKVEDNFKDISHLDDWYKVRFADFVAVEGAASLVQNFQGSLHKSLEALYPEHSWDPKKFVTQVPRGYWKGMTF
jgi:hypothetical protein